MRLDNVRLVFLKEMRDTLRDRRTLFVSVILPLFLYPLLMIGFTQVIAASRKEIYEDEQQVAFAPGRAASLRERIAAVKGLALVEEGDPAAALAGERIDAWVEADPEFDAAVAERRPAKVEVHFDSTRDASRAARQKIEKALAEFGRQVLVDRGLPPADIEPLEVAPADLASQGQRGAKEFGPLLALLLVTMALSGAFYPAVDVMAGEKERGTMETLLVCPATRTEIVLGKYLTVMAMTVATAMLNFASMALTFSWFAKMLSGMGSAGGMTLSIGPGTAGVIVVALLPLAGLFSAVALALSTFARSYKEGQHYLSPMFIVVMPLSMVALVPGVELSTFAALPVANVVLLVRDLMLGTAGATDVLLVLGSTGVLAGIAIAWTISMFNREDVLFRDPGGAEFTLFRRSRIPGGTPSAGQALTVLSLALIALFFVATRFGQDSVVVAFLAPQGLCLLLPLLAIHWYRLDWRRTLSLRAPGRPATDFAAAAIGAPSALVLLLVLLSGFVEPTEDLRALEEQFRKLVDTVGRPVVLLVPPIVEEIFFRGFFLAGMRGKRKAWVAVLVTATAFAVFHLLPEKYLTTGLLGIWLGYLAVRTGSLYPAILAHLLNNAIPLHLGEHLGDEATFPWWYAVPAAAGLIAAFALVEIPRRRPAIDRQ